MKRMILTLVVAAVAASFAIAQTGYSGGLPLLKRRPFAPGGSGFAPPPVVVEHDEQPLPIVKMPIFSPYSMIRYNLPRLGTPTETLPAPRPMTMPAPPPKLP